MISFLVPDNAKFFKMKEWVDQCGNGNIGCLRVGHDYMFTFYGPDVEADALAFKLKFDL